MENINSIISELGFSSIEDAARVHARLIILGKISKYQAEYNVFKQKYKCEYLEFAKKIDELRETEDFEKEDDLMDWEYAYQLLEKYKKQEVLLSND